MHLTCYNKEQSQLKTSGKTAFDTKAHLIRQLNQQQTTIDFWVFVMMMMCNSNLDGMSLFRYIAETRLEFVVCDCDWKITGWEEVNDQRSHS